MLYRRIFTSLIVRPGLLAVLAAPLAAQQLTPAERSRIDSAASAILAATGAPSTSVAVVRGGVLAYEQAYGEGRIGTPATPGMRYSIGSVSKQFTSLAAVKQSAMFFCGSASSIMTSCSA